VGTKISKNRKLKRMLANILSIVAILAIAFPATGSVNAQDEVPTLYAEINFDWVDGWDWPTGDTVALTIKESGGGDTIYYDTSIVGTNNPDQPNYVRFNVGEGEEPFDVRPGLVISLEDLNTSVTKTHTVLNIGITDVDTSSNIVTGYAARDTSLNIIAHNPCWQTVEVTADGPDYLEEGYAYWYADFTGLCELDIVEYINADQPGTDDVNVSTGFFWSPPPKPRFTVYPVWNAVEAWDWPDGAAVTATISGTGCFASGEAGYPDWDPSTTNVWMNFPEGCDVTTDDVVTLTAEGVAPVSHTVQNLSVTNVNADAETVSGTADSGVTVYVWPHEFGEYEVQPTAGGDGGWSADFSGFGDDVLQPGMDGRAEIRDGYGNSTAVDWHVPKPRFTVYPVWEAVEAWDWPAGVQVTATVTGNEDNCTIDGYPIADPWGTNVWMNFPEGCDVVAGNDVILSVEGVTPVSHIVQNLSVTEVNADTDTVTGTADVGATVYVWPHQFGEYELQPTAGGDNVWTADFSGFGDDVLQPGMDGRAEVRDNYGNSTAVDWHTPNTRFTVWPEWNYLEGYEWPGGSIVSISVTDKDGCSTEAVASFPDGDPSNTYFSLNFPGGCAIEAGDFITLSNETLSLTHQVQELTITEVSLDNNTVAGTAVYDAEQYNFHTWINGVDESYMQLSTESGAWLADFNSLEGGLQPGMRGRVELTDQASNSTTAEWYIPNPWFSAFPEGEIVEGWDWPLGATLLLTINGDDYSATETSLITPWEPESGATWVWFEFPGAYDMKPGDVVTLTDGITERTHVVQNLDITEINLDENQVYGTTDGEKNVILWSWEDPEGRRIETTSEGDYWGVDFDDIGFTLKPSYHVRAEIWVDGNDTAVDRYIPNPRFTVFPEWEWFDGLDWPDGVTVSITIEGKDGGKDECTTEGTSSDYFFNGGFPEGCDVVIGDTVTFTDGETVRTHTVRNLSVTKVEPGNDIVKGTADAGAEIHVWPHATGQEQIVATNPKGKWNVSFMGIYDMMPGDGGRSEIRDDVGNATAVDWYIPRPHIVASITEDWFFLQEFSPNKTLSFTVYQGQGEKPIWKGTATTDDSGFAWIDAEGRWDLEPGVYLVVKDGSNSKDLVIEGFTFDIFDAANGQLSGTAPEPDGRNVWVGVGWEGDGWSMDITTDENGAWFADFGSPVPTDYQWVAAQIFDDDGDASELRPASQIIFLRPACGDTYTVQAGSALELRYGSWVAIGEELANQNADHLTVELVLNGEMVVGEKQPVVPRSEIPCGTPIVEDAYGVYYLADVGPLSPGTYIATVTWSFDEAVTDGYDANGDGVPEWYGPGVVGAPREFTIIVP